MALAIKIGTSANVYTDVATAYANRGNQKLSIIGTGTEITAALSDMRTAVSGIGSIKATSDIVLSADNVTLNKAVLLKLGSRSVVTSDTASEIKDNFSALDAVYNKMKSLVSAGAVSITADDLTTSSNLNGIENLVGRGNFSVVAADAADFAQNLSAMVKNASKINAISLTAGTGTVTAAQLSLLGGKMSTGAAVLSDTADNILSSAGLAAYTASADKVATINITKATIAQIGQINTLISATTLDDAKLGDAVIQDSAVNLNNSTDLADAITLVKAWNSNAGTASKVVIEGNGSLTTKTILDSIKTNSADAGAVAYSGKALDVQANMAVLAENIAGGATGVDQIIVTDGTIAAKKQFNVTYSQYSTVAAAFTAGQSDSTNSNYGYIVTGVSRANAGAVQTNAKVSSFSVTAAPKADIDTTAELTTLLGYSKLKTATIATGFSASDLTTVRTALSAVASNTDRAKLKFIA